MSFTFREDPFLVLAPMQGVIDPVMRQLLTENGGFQLCISEFIRVTQTVLPSHVFLKYVPEIQQRGQTKSNVPVYLQLLGSHPQLMAENAQKACELGALGIDLNFGCPAKTVNRHQGGAVLLDNPELIYKIVSLVRQHMPPTHPLSAKIRLGYKDTSKLIENVQAIESAGASFLTIHTRTQFEGYSPPAHWEFLNKIKDNSSLPLIANGDIFSSEDYLNCRKQSGFSAYMLGRGVLYNPLLAYSIKHSFSSSLVTWTQTLMLLNQYFQLSQNIYSSHYAMIHVIQWLNYLKKTFSPAQTLFDKLKTSRTPYDFETLLQI